MPFAASHSRDADLDRAVDDACRELKSRLGNRPPDLCFLFVSHHHADGFEGLSARVQADTGAGALLGCTGETIVAGGEEIEAGPALSLWGAELPGAVVQPFHIEFARTPDGLMSSGFPEFENAEAGATAVFLLGEPFTSVPRALLDRFEAELPGVPVIGGMASGATAPGQNRLFLNGQSLPEGAVGVVLQGGPRIRTVVSQGCRPIGETFVITRAERNVVHELGGVPPLKRLQDLFPTLTQRDRELVRQGVHLGIAMSEYQDTYERGDFLISNVIGADGESGALALGNVVRVGQTVQFHVRDAHTADEDLVCLLEQSRKRSQAAPGAALLFSCNGRGTRLFPHPHHDAGTLQRVLGPLPLAGFFAQGELGPVGRKNYIHGFTASIALFE